MHGGLSLNQYQYLINQYQCLFTQYLYLINLDYNLVNQYLYPFGGEHEHSTSFSVALDFA